MWIERVQLEGIGPFRSEHSFDFTAGATVVTGGNESGKTSLLEAIQGTFFGLNVNCPLINGSDSAWSEVVFHVDGAAYRLRRNFREVTVRFERTEPGAEVIFEGSVEAESPNVRFLECLLGVLGVSDGSLWTLGGFVRDGDVRTRVDEAIRVWMDAAPANAREAVERLERRGGEFTGSVRGAPGPLDELRHDLEMKREECERWDDTAREVRATNESLQTRAEELAAAQQAAEEHGEKLENLVRFEQLSQEQSRLEERLGELREERDRVRKHVEHEERMERELEDNFAAFLDAPTDMEDLIQIWVDVSTRLAPLEREMARAERALAELRDLHTRRNGLLLGGGLGVLAWVAFLGAGAPEWGTAVSPLFALGGFGAVWSMDRSAGQLRASRMAEVERLRAEHAELKQSRDESKRDLGAIAADADPSKLRKQFRAYLQAREQVERARGICASHRTLRVVVDEYEQVFGELQILDTQTRDLVARARFLSGLDAKPQVLTERVETERQAREEARLHVQKLEMGSADLRSELDRLRSGTQEPGRLAEDVEVLAERERRLDLRAGALSDAARMLQEAIRASEGEQVDRVTARASEWFCRWTGDRYQAVRLRPRTGLEVQAGEGWQKSDALTPALQDQLHLALRLALHAQTTGPRGLPILLDEAFPRWDDRRLALARQAVTQLTDEGFQVILFTADPRLAGDSLPLVDLPDAARRPAA